jgi:hypothetical protein
MKKSEIYLELWLKNRNEINNKLLNSNTKQFIQLNPKDFKNVGNRKSYSFNLEFINGKVSNNISNSAVARDLAKMIDNSIEIIELIKIGHYKINMDCKFCLWLIKMN